MDNQFYNQTFNPTPVQSLYQQNNYNKRATGVAPSVMGFIGSLAIRNISFFFISWAVFGPAFNDSNEPHKVIFWLCLAYFFIGFSVEVLNFLMVLDWRDRQKNSIKGTKAGKNLATVALVISLVCIILLVIGFFVSLIGVLSSDYLTMQL